MIRVDEKQFERIEKLKALIVGIADVMDEEYRYLYAEVEKEKGETTSKQPIIFLDFAKTIYKAHNELIIYENYLKELQNAKE